MTRRQQRSTLFPYTTLFRSSERITQMNTEKEVVQDGKTKKKEKKLYLCFVDYQKAFDGVKHDKLVEIKEKARSEEHTSELQSQSNLVCRLLLEKKKKKKKTK